jgi:predicted esterase
MTVRGTLAGFEHRFDPGFDETPVLLLLHGTGGDEEDLIPLGQALLPRAARVSPRGQVLEHGAPRFFRRLAEGVFDQEDLARRTKDLARFVREATSTYHLEGRRVIAVGFSNGANIVASLLLSGERVLDVAVLFRAMLPYEPEQLPKLSGFPVLLSSGRRDPIIPPASVERLAYLFENAGAAVTLQWDQGAHGIGPPQVTAAKDWLDKTLRSLESAQGKQGS